VNEARARARTHCLSDVDVAVIGGGPAGMAAAASAANDAFPNGDDGDRPAAVVLIERHSQLGGVLPQCIHDGFGTLLFGQQLTGPEMAHRLQGAVVEAGVHILRDTTLLGISHGKGSGGFILEVTSPAAGPRALRAKAVVLAAGCRERTRFQVGISGTRPSGVYTAGSAQYIVNRQGLLPGRRVVILGSGDVGLIMARRLTWEGAEVLGVFEIMPYPGGLMRNVVQCLHDYEIPLHLKHTVTEVHGGDRVEGVTVCRVDGNLTPLAGSERFIECDTLILSVGLIPEIEPLEELGVEIDGRTGGPAVSQWMETSVPGLYACGNLVHIHDLVDYACWGGQVAGWAAARRALGAGGQNRPGGRAFLVRPGAGTQYVVPQRMEINSLDHWGAAIGADSAGISFYLRPDRPLAPAEVIISAKGFPDSSSGPGYGSGLYSLSDGGVVFRKLLRAVTPGEMIRAHVTEDRLREALVRAGEQGYPTMLEACIGAPISQYLRTPAGMGKDAGESKGPREGKDVGRGKDTGGGRESGSGALNCIVCPRGCAITVSEGPGSTLDVTGHGCPRGRDYGMSEYRNPVRTVTTTLPVVGASGRRVAVVTATPVPRYDVPWLLGDLNAVSVKTPVSVGQVVYTFTKGDATIDIMATEDIEAREPEKRSDATNEDC